MRKTIFLAFTAIILMTACQNRCNTKINDYLYGIEYDKHHDYDFEKGTKEFAKMNPASPGCSEARKGSFVGRNLDWYINQEASAIIKVAHTDKHLASIGMVGCSPKFSEELAQSGNYDEIYEILPLFTCDGINEKGVYVGVNVMPTGETSLDSTHWQSGKWGIGAANTHLGADKSYCTTYLVRYILDHATSVAHARQLIDAVNWFEPYGFPSPGASQAFHWLICDKGTSMVVEFLDNKVHYIVSNRVNEPSYATLMTNFTNTLMKEANLVQTTGIGYERFNVLENAYAQTEESLDGMLNLMKKVWFTNTYTKEYNSDDFWFTEYTCAALPSPLLYSEGAAIWKDSYFVAVVNKNKTQFNDPSQWHTPNTSLWYTTHTSVYDLDKLEMRVLTHEGLEDQKEPYAVNFKSKFEKPLAHR